MKPPDHLDGDILFRIEAVKDKPNTAIANVDKVTRRNAATSEESSSASEEMSSRAEEMKLIVQGLVNLIEGGKGGTAGRPSLGKAGGYDVMGHAPEPAPQRTRVTLVPRQIEVTSG